MIVSTQILNEKVLRNLNLLNQADAENNKVPYFLAATVQIVNQQSNSFQSYIFIEGEEQVTGLNAKLSTIGIFHIYIRAVSLQKVCISMNILLAFRYSMHCNSLLVILHVTRCILIVAFYLFMCQVKD